MFNTNTRGKCDARPTFIFPIIIIILLLVLLIHVIYIEFVITDPHSPASFRQAKDGDVFTPAPESRLKDAIAQLNIWSEDQIVLKQVVHPAPQSMARIVAQTTKLPTTTTKPTIQIKASLPVTPLSRISPKAVVPVISAAKVTPKSPLPVAVTRRIPTKSPSVVQNSKVAPQKVQANKIAPQTRTTPKVPALLRSIVQNAGARSKMSPTIRPPTKVSSSVRPAPVKLPRSDSNHGQVCPPAMHFSQSLPVTALYSFPGSGNTWVRHLLQIATGIYTGSIYNDLSLLEKGFTGEYHRDGSVIAIKTHVGPFNNKNHVNFERAVVIYRDPQHSILAEANRRHSQSHVGVLSQDYSPADSIENIKEVDAMIHSWKEINCNWMVNFTKELHIVHFDRLKSNLQRELTALLKFLNWPVKQTHIDCVMNNAEGQFRRKKTAVDVNNFYRKEQKKRMEAYTADVQQCIRERKSRGYPLSST